LTTQRAKSRRKNGARLTSRIVVIAGVLGLGVACHVDVDLAGKACPCVSPFVCEPVSQVCVTPGEIAADSGVPDGQVVPTCGDNCLCNVEKDCLDPARSRCSPAMKCVECTQKPVDTCPSGNYCNDSFQCTLGCKQESDCQISPNSPHCQTTRHQCVECVTNDQCTGGKACSPSGVCVVSCTPPAPPCATGACCTGLCVDTKNDPLECGGCGTACVTTNGTPNCVAGACSWPQCANGFAHCSTGNTGCETNIRSNLAHCGSCTKSCDAVLNANNVACTAGACTFTTCQAGFGDCDGNMANGCECACGALKMQACCPGDKCTNGLTCNTNSHKCM
jgi:hypothetical protein